jgi:nucleotide-binding universal stress UspA family protein
MTYRIVVGVDGSPHSEAALRWALEDAEARQGEVTAIFAWQVPFLSIPGAYDREELEATYKKYIVEIVSAVAPSPPVPPATVVAEGDPAEALIVASDNAELLVLGTRGRSPFAGLVLGSVAQRCAAAARCPVVLIKVPADSVATG